MSSYIIHQTRRTAPDTKKCYTHICYLTSYHCYYLRESNKYLFSFQPFMCSLQPWWFYWIKQVPWDFYCLGFYSFSLASFYLFLPHFYDCGGTLFGVHVRLACLTHFSHPLPPSKDLYWVPAFCQARGSYHFSFGQREYSRGFGRVSPSPTFLRTTLAAGKAASGVIFTLSKPHLLPGHSWLNQR